MWDYSKLAATYDNRPGYSESLINVLFDETNAKVVCDIGAGTGILTLQLLKRALVVVPVEPNAEMRQIGQSKVKTEWVNATAENTGLETGFFDLVTYGSSFNVCHLEESLRETHRILKVGGFVACLWNHRDLTDPLQHSIEELIHSVVPGYQHGGRREDQTHAFISHGWSPRYFEGPFVHKFTRDEFISGMKSHYTLKSQSGDKFDFLLEQMFKIIPNEFDVPYKTVMWIAK